MMPTYSELASRQTDNLFSLCAFAANGIVIITACISFIGFGSNQSPWDLMPVIVLIELAALVLLKVLLRKRFRLAWAQESAWDTDRPKSSLAPGFHALLVVVGLHSLQNQTLLDKTFGLWAAIVSGILLGALLWRDERPENWAAMPATILSLVFASWSIVQVTNSALDTIPGTTYRTSISAMDFTTPHCSGSEKYGTCTGSFGYHLRLVKAPYGAPESLGVSNRLYSSLRAGDHICITMHAGRFGARWFEFDRCQG